MISRRRRSSIHEQFLGHRRRRGSTVESIATNVPTIEIVGNANAHLGYRRNRSNSMSILETKMKSNNETFEHDGLMLYPFSKLERDEIWHKETETLESDLSIDVRDEISLENFQLQDVSNFQRYLKFILHENTYFENEVDEIAESLDELLTINDQVGKQTGDFKGKSDSLVSDLEILSNLQKKLSEKLQYFESLDDIVQTLNTSSSGSIVLQQDFRKTILVSLDQSIKFVNDPNNSKFKEIDLYKLRFKQCMIRALTLLRNYINSHIRRTQQLIEQKVKAQGNTADTNSSTSSKIMIDALMYEEFIESLVPISDLFKELYKRGFVDSDDSNEYFGLLNDCYNQYFSSRNRLLSYVPIKYDEIINKCNHTSQAVQSCLTRFNKMLQQESRVFHKLFYLSPSELVPPLDNTTNAMAMNKFFQGLMDPLYETIRKRLLSETNIEELCEIISILESFFEQDDTAIERSVTMSGTDDFESGNDIDYENLLRQLFEDVQSRLVFRIRRYIDGNVVNYKRTGKEMAIGFRRKNSHSQGMDSELDISAKGNLSEGSIITTNSEFPVDTSLIYPPVVKSVKLLSKIYQLVSQNVFNTLANSIVHLAIESLRNAFDDDISLDSKLYEIRNMMFLKDYISTFEVDGSTKEIALDFSGLRKLYHRITGRKDNRTDRSILSSAESNNPFFAAMPRVVTKYFNCKVEIQENLKDMIRKFIDIVKQVFVQPLSDYSEKTDLATTTSTFMSVLESELPRLGPQINNYISDQQTTYALIDGVQGEVINAYEAFYKKACDLNKDSEQLKILPSEEDVISTWGSIIGEMMNKMDIERSEVGSRPDGSVAGST